MNILTAMAIEQRANRVAHYKNSNGATRYSMDGITVYAFTQGEARQYSQAIAFLIQWQERLAAKQSH